jgi:hypothetical protein
MVGLSNVDNTSDATKPVSTATQTALDAKANLNAPTFTGTVGGITKSMVGLSNVDNTSDASKPISTATQTALNAKANSNNAILNGNIGINTTTADSALHIVGVKIDTPSTVGIRMGKTSNFLNPATDSYGIEICSDTSTSGGSYIDFTFPYGSTPNYYAGRMLFHNDQGYFAWNADWLPSGSEAITTPFQMQLDRFGTLIVQNSVSAPAITLNGTDLTTTLESKANLNSPTFTGTVGGISKAMVGLGNVDNTSDASKPVSTATQTALNLKANLNAPTFTGTLTVDGATVGPVIHLKTGAMTRGIISAGMDNVMTLTAGSKLFLFSDGSTTTVRADNTTVAEIISSGMLLKNSLTLTRALPAGQTPTNTKFETDDSGSFTLTQKSPATNNLSITALSVYPNGVLSTGGKVNNKVICLYEGGTVSDDPASATNFVGFGINGTGILRYQVPLSTDIHRFYAGSTEVFSMNGAITACYTNFSLDRTELSGEVRATVSNNATTGTSSYILKTNNGSQTSKLYMDQTGLVKFDRGSTTAFEVYPNGVLTAGKKVNNKVFTLYEMGSSSDAPSTATNFYGLGINAETFRYQVPTTSNTHKFYCGATLGYTISSTGGVGPSDIRWKSEIENVDNALEAVCKLKAKKFKYLNTEGVQLGFIAQEVYDVQPELVYVDKSTDDKFMSLKYDRFSALHNEAIKELLNKINKLEERLNMLENKI